VEIITELVAAGTTRVIPFAESTLLRGQPPSKVAEMLRVDAVLEGSVRVEGSRRRISLSLLRGGSLPVWSHTFYRPSGTFLDVQREIARAVANHVRPLLPPGARRFEPAMELRDLYWAGRSCQYNGELAQAAAKFEQLTQLEPGYALAYAALGEVLGAMETIAGGSDYSRAISAASRAAEIDPHLAEAYVSLGVTRCRMLDWRGAEAEFERAIAADPSYGPAHGEYARNVLMPMRRFREAVAESRRCAELDPDSFYAHLRLGYALLLNGQHQEAVRALGTARRIAPKSLWPTRELARGLLSRGEPDEAIRNLTGDDSVLLAIAHYQAGRLAESEKWMSPAMVATARDPVQRAVLLIGTGRIAEGLALAESDSARRSLLFPTLAFDPILEPARKHPRFRTVLENARLPF
jgi:tetratricopeptide (TPR) repeat protein